LRVRKGRFAVPHRLPSRVRLGRWFGTSAEFWLNLQSLYELRLAQQEAGDRIKKLPRHAGRKRKSDRRLRAGSVERMRTKGRVANVRGEQPGRFISIAP
jgi:hypothetical protein